MLPYGDPNTTAAQTAMQTLAQYGVTQAQLARLYASFPSQGSVDGHDGSPDTLWMTTHTWGPVGSNGGFEPVEGWTGEYRISPSAKFMIYNNWLDGSYAVAPVLTSGWLGEFAIIASMILGPVISWAAAGGATGGTTATAETGASAAGSATTTDLTQSGLTSLDTGASNMGEDFSFTYGDAGGLGDLSSGGFDVSGSVGDVGAGAGDWGGSFGDIGIADYTVPDLGSLAQSTFPDVSATSGGVGGFGFSLSDVQSVLRTVGGLYSTWQTLGGQGPKMAVPTQTSAGTVTPNRNGTLTTRAPNGQSITQPMTPGVPYTFPDGTIVMNNGNGTYTVTSLDGTSHSYSYPSSVLQPGGALGMNNTTLLLVAGGLGAALLLSRRRGR